MPTTISRPLKWMAGWQLVIGATGTPFWGWSFALGAGLMLANLLLLAWTSWRLLAKKPIAWTVGIIVIKYAVLLGSVVYFARRDGFDPLGAGLGVASFVLAVLGAAIVTSKSATTEIEKIKLKKKLKRKRNEIGSSTL